MLCRSSTIEHRETGVTLTTPLLIPSYSSKGFATLEESGKSEIGKILEATSEFVREVLLISAYDIFYEHIPQPIELECAPEIFVVDSGGYEIMPGCDFSSPMVSPYGCEPWSLEHLKVVYDNWPDRFPAVFVSFDHPEVRKPLADQISDAQRLFQSRSHHFSSLLLKPESKEHDTINGTLESAVAAAADLGSFHIGGVTEKELGRTMLDRMRQIARLRMALDGAGVMSPLHIFGALDPLSVCLYFIAGAEIFDGLTWLRYAYRDGICTYTHNFGVIKYGLDMPDDLVRWRTTVANYEAILSLQRRLTQFVETRNFDKLEPHSELLLRACHLLQAEFGRRN